MALPTSARSGLSTARLAMAPEAFTHHGYQALVCRNLHLVRGIVRDLMRRLPRSVEEDDLIQNGMVGLLEAARRFENRDGASFSSYALPRIRGAIIDGSRRSDWCSRALRPRLRSIEAARRHLESGTGLTASPSGVAAAAEITLDEYHAAMRDFNASIPLSLDAPELGAAALNMAQPMSGSDDPADQLDRDAALSAMLTQIDQLPQTERTIFSLYYDEGFLMREIGMKLALSESRVSQLHKRSIGRLRQAASGALPSRRLAGAARRLASIHHSGAAACRPPGSVYRPKSMLKTHP